MIMKLLIVFYMCPNTCNRVTLLAFRVPAAYVCHDLGSGLTATRLRSHAVVAS